MPLSQPTPFFAGFSAAILATGAVLAQTPPRQTPDLLVPVSTEVVRIDVIVTEKNGKPRSGLTKDDFAVLEDGQPQTITQFEAFTSPVARPLPDAASPAVTRSEGEDEPPVRTVPPRRYVVLAVDDIHIASSNLLRIKKALDRFLEREIGPEDQVAIVTTSGTRKIYQEFTDDRHVLQRSIARLSVQDKTVAASGIPYVTEYQAEQIERGDQEALRVAVEEVLQSGLYQDADSAEPVARAAAHVVLAESIHNGRLTLETLDSVVRGLADLQGRKLVVLVSDGFVAGMTVNGGAAFDIRRISDAGTRSGVVIYALDTRGLVATAPGRSASSRMPMLVSTFSARDNMQRESDYATRDAMNALAGDTGGFLVQDTNDLGAGLRKVLKDSETYYLIAYESTNPKRDGAFRKLEVRLKNERDLRIRTRKGYFAPDDRKFRLAPPSTPPPALADLAREAEERRESEMKLALTSLAPQNGIPVRLSADFVSVDGAAPQVVVSSHVDLRDVPFVTTGDRHVATVDAAATVFDESGAVVGSLAPERAAMDLTDASYQQALSRGLDYQKAVALKPGRYRVRIAVREDAGGKLGSASQWVQVPDLSDGKLALSGLFLLEKEDTPGAASKPAETEDLSLRGVQARRRFRRGETLYAQLFAYNPGRDASGATKLVSQAEIWRGGELLASSTPEAMTAGERSGPPVPHTRSIKLTPFGPGEYEVRIVVTDALSNKMTSRRAAFSIE
jgi:VWFA-related protein